MNTLEKLQQAASSDIKDLSFRGIQLRIRKLSAQEGIEVNRLMPQPPFDDLAAITAFHVFIASKSLVGDDGKPDTDSEDGRAALAKLPLAHLAALSDECLEFSQPAKKNGSGTNSTCSPSASASPSESSTPTT